MDDSDDATDAERRFRGLYTSEAVALLGYVARRIDRTSDGADIVAEVFTIAWRRIADVPEADEARPWLYGVARNVLANHRRGVMRRDRLVDRLRGELRVMTSATADAPEDIHDLREALARLADDDRELLLLTNWEGLTPTQIAVAMGIPAGTVRSRLHKARTQLRRELGITGTGPQQPTDIERCVPIGHVSGSGHSPAAEHEEPR